MSSETLDQTTNKSSSTLGWMDALSGLGAVGGAAASVATQQIAFATVPLSVAVMLKIFSRQQQVQALTEANQSLNSTVVTVQKKLVSLAEEAQQVSKEHRRLIDGLNQANNQHNLETLTLGEKLEEHNARLAEQAGQLDAFDSMLQSIKEISAVGLAEAHMMSAEAHVNRGSHQEKLGHIEIAIEEYTQAIKQSPNYAEAYLCRAMAKVQLGRKQSAVIDFNVATKHFFEAGDLANYQRSKDLVSNLHREEEAESTNSKAEANDLVSVNGLFD